MMKFCKYCKKEFDITDEKHWYKSPSKSMKLKYQLMCREYDKNRKQKYYERHKDTDQYKHRINKTRLRWNYDLSLEQYNQILEFQKYKCCICSKSFLEKSKIYIDHNHITQEVRGLLCPSCNTILGLSKEDVNILFQIIKYIKTKGLASIIKNIKERN